LAVVAHQACEGPPSALEAHDPAAAERAMRNHVKRSYARFTTYFD
jgi:DNA-binding GntR family transcriptional regulator